MEQQWSLHWTTLLHNQFSSVTQLSNSLWPHRLQHTRLPCSSPSPGACSNLCPSSRWCHPTIWSSVIPFSSCLQSFPASGSFPMSQFFTSGGQTTGVSASISVLPVNIQVNEWILSDEYFILHIYYFSNSFNLFSHWASQVALVVKSPSANAGDTRDASSIPGSRRSPGGEHSNPLQYSCLENPMDRGAWQATVHRVAELDTTDQT